MQFGASYAWAMLFPRRPGEEPRGFLHQSLRPAALSAVLQGIHGESVGTPCDRISADWGAQRVKSLSVAKALLHALLKPFRKSSPGGAQENLAYRALPVSEDRPGADVGDHGRPAARARGAAAVSSRRWRGWSMRAAESARAIVRRADGGEIRLRSRQLHFPRCRCATWCSAWRRKRRAAAREIGGRPRVPRLHHRGPAVPAVSARGRVPRQTGSTCRKRGVKVGRLQVFNNWSPYLVRDPGHRLDRHGVLLPGRRRIVDAAGRRDAAAGCGGNAQAAAGAPRGSARRGGDPHAEGLSRLLRQLRTLRRTARLSGRIRQPVPGRAQRHAPLQQPGPFDALGKEGRGGDPCRRARTRARSGPSTSTTSTTKKRPEAGPAIAGAARARRGRRNSRRPAARRRSSRWPMARRLSA